MKTVIRHLRRAALLLKGDGPSDSQLLESFLCRREDTAFEALLRRHGPMVLGVCRRVLRNAHDAEDAFQATFLVLLRKGGSLRSRELLANWLYGVAYRTAMKARAMNAKRRAKEKHAGAIPRSEASPSGGDEALLAQLDHELSRLPDKYRVPVVLCELQGKSRKEAARLIGLPEGTLSWRLAQAKKMLAKRLSRHGAALSVGAVATAMMEETILAGLSPALQASTLKAVLSAGTVPAKVLALTDGVLKVMLLTKLKITVCFAALGIGIGVGATGLTYRATAEEPKLTAIGVRSIQSAESRPQADDLDALRLEIEALRKELRATRERVKALEEEVRGPKKLQTNVGDKLLAEAEVQQALKMIASNKQAAEAVQQALKMNPGDKQFSELVQQALKMNAGDKQLAEAVQRALKGRTDKQAAEAVLRWKIRQPDWQKGQPDDPLSDAIEAMKKLQMNPGDKQAAEAVERALKWLKEREKGKNYSEEKK